MADVVLDSECETAKQAASRQGTATYFRWLIVAGCLSGLMVGSAAINTFGFSVLLKALGSQLGLTRGDISLGVAISHTLTAAASLFVGYLMDRFGIRRIMLPGILLFALATSAYGLVPAEHAGLIYVVFVLGGLATAVQQPIGYVKMISLWFDDRRGFALGIALSGVGLGGLLMPQIASSAEHHYGTALAFVTLAAAILILAFLPVALLLREPSRPAVNAGSSVSAVTGDEYDLRRAVKEATFWRLNLALFLAVCAINGTLTHMVPMLTDRGLSPQQAANVLSFAGVFITVGRVVAGWCLDRYRGQAVAAFFVSAPMVGLGLLLSGASGIVPIAGGILCGLGVGAEVDLIAFFLGRYFGLRSIASLFGFSAAVLSLATAAGPYVMGKVFDAAGSYAPALIAFEFLLLFAMVLFVTLGQYRFRASTH